MHLFAFLIIACLWVNVEFWWNIYRMSVSLMSSNMDVTFEKYINNKINRLHERASRIVCSNYASSFQGLLNKDNAFSIHESFAIEIYKYWIIYSMNIYQTRKLFEIDKNFIPEILRQLHMELKPYYIWHLKFGARFLKLWKWAHLDKSECVCRLCAKYLQHVGFFNYISAVIDVFMKIMH